MQSTIVNYLVTHKKLLIRTCILLIILGAGLVVVKNYALINLTVKNPEAKGSNAVVTFANFGVRSESVGTSGVMVVPRSTKSLIITQGENSKLQTPVQIPWYGYVEKTVSLTLDRNADKVAYTSTLSEPCAVYSKRLESLLAYDCKKPKALSRFITPENKNWGSVLISQLGYANGKIEPYLNGVIGITGAMDGDAEDHGIVIADDTGEITFYNTPEGVDLVTLRQSKIITDAANPQNRHFIVITPGGDAYLGTPSPDNKSVDYAWYAPPTNYSSSYQHTICKLINETVYCYYGDALLGDTKTPDNVPDPSIAIIQFGNKAESYATSENIIDNIFVTSDGKIYGIYAKKLFLFVKKNNRYNQREIAQNVDFVSSGNKLTVIQQNSVFMASKEGDELRQVFYSKNINPKSIYQTEDKLFVIAIAAKRKNATFAYLLNDSPNNHPGQRLIDKFPTEQRNLPGTQDQDFIGNRLFLSLTSDNKTSLDPLYISEQKASVNDGIKALGIDTDTISIQFAR